MSERHRKLPSWMAIKEEGKEKLPLRSKRKQELARAAFYCMNEKELVDAALSYLTSAACQGVVLTAEQRAVDTRMKMKENPSTDKRPAKLVTEEEESSACSGAQETPYVSESDVDITELVTVQYAESQQHQGPEPVQHHDRLMGAGLESERKDECSQMAAEPDDALQLVREIFFT